MEATLARSASCHVLRGLVGALARASSSGQDSGRYLDKDARTDASSWITRESGLEQVSEYNKKGVGRADCESKMTPGGVGGEKGG